jgi:hypothetical protein
LGSTAISSGSGPESIWRHDFELLGVDHVDDVAVAGRDIDFGAVRTGDDAAGTPCGGYGLDHLERLAVDNGDGVVLFIGDINLLRKRRDREGEYRGRSREQD